MINNITLLIARLFIQSNKIMPNKQLLKYKSDIFVSLLIEVHFTPSLCYS